MYKLQYDNFLINEHVMMMMSVCPWRSDENGLKYRQFIFFAIRYSPIILVLQASKSSRNSDGVTSCGGAKYRFGIKISRFSTNKSLYLARYRHSYYGRQIGTRMRSIKWCHFNDLERTLTLFPRSHHSLMLNIWQTATDRAIVTIHNFISP